MRLTLTISVLIVLLISSVLNAENQQSPKLDRQLSTEGFITISWDDLDYSSPLEIQLAMDPSFNQLVRRIKLLNQNSVHLSGFSDGLYYVRLIEDNARIIGEVSTFTVKHRQFTDAIKLFVLGALLFVFLLATLYRYSAKA
mgnify:FL=1